MEGFVSENIFLKADEKLIKVNKPTAAINHLNFLELMEMAMKKIIKYSRIIVVSPIHTFLKKSLGNCAIKKKFKHDLLLLLFRFYIHSLILWVNRNIGSYCFPRIMSFFCEYPTSR